MLEVYFSDRDFGRRIIGFVKIGFGVAAAYENDNNEENTAGERDVFEALVICH